MSRILFGTDGVRGLAGSYPLDNTGACQIGRAVGQLFASPGESIVIAMDTRESSEELLNSVSSGLQDVGVNVTSIGVIPTPGLSFVTRQNREFAAGVMITASHNPYQYNGVKVFDSHGDKLNDETETKLNELIDSQIAQAKQAGSFEAHASLIQEYEDFLVSSADGLDLNGIALAIDTANGAACGIGARIFSKLGASVTALFDSPDGRNINAGCGATDTAALKQTIIANKLSLGIAVDGDADRLILIDDQGAEVKGDTILYILAVSGHQKGVVATVMSNLGLEQALSRHDIDFLRTDVGDRYVLSGMKQAGYTLGGEQSGHIIMTDLLATGDGLLAAVQTMRALSSSGKTLRHWNEEIQFLPQAIVNIPLPDKTQLKQPAFEHYISDQTEKFAGKGRVVIRSSGTEPLARVMVEADNAQEIAETIASELTRLMENSNDKGEKS